MNDSNVDGAHDMPRVTIYCMSAADLHATCVAINSTVCRLDRLKESIRCHLAILLHDLTIHKLILKLICVCKTIPLCLTAH